jgi:hypothetical protein
MTRIKQIKKSATEIYVLLSVIAYWIMTGTILNPIAIFLVAVLAVLMWKKNRTLGISFSAVFLILNLYMVLALISELNKFSAFDGEAITMAITGSAYLGLNIFVALVMLIKWTVGTPELTPQN